MRVSPVRLWPGPPSFSTELPQTCGPAPRTGCAALRTSRIPTPRTHRALPLTRRMAKTGADRLTSRRPVRENRSSFAACPAPIASSAITLGVEVAEVEDSAYARPTCWPRHAIAARLRSTQSGVRDRVCSRGVPHRHAGACVFVAPSDDGARTARDQTGRAPRSRVAPESECTARREAHGSLGGRRANGECDSLRRRAAAMPRLPTPATAIASADGSGTGAIRTDTTPLLSPR